MTAATPAAAGAVYEGAGKGWAAGPARVYDQLAAALVRVAPAPLEGGLVLDAGAGTGAVMRALCAAGASVVACDLALDMLRHARPRPRAAVVADVRRLPLRDRCVDAAVAAFVLSHVDDPVAALAEMARVTRAGGVVLASCFAAGDVHPVKATVHDLLRDEGYAEPDWYLHLKTVETRVATEDGLADVAVAAGLTDVTVQRTVVAVTAGAAAQVAYRLGMAQYAEFLRTLSSARRARVAAAAVAACARRPQPLRPEVLMLLSRVAAARSKEGRRAPA